MKTLKKRRCIRIIVIAVLVLFFGILYGLFVDETGYGIPCLFHEITGLKCPGCGVTHMLIELMHLNFKKAFECNQALFILMFPYGILTFRSLITYLNGEKVPKSRALECFDYATIVFLLLFGIFRNL